MILNLVRQTKYLDTRIYKLIAGLTPSSLAIQAKYHPFVGYLTCVMLCFVDIINYFVPGGCLFENLTIVTKIVKPFLG